MFLPLCRWCVMTLSLPSVATSRRIVVVAVKSAQVGTQVSDWLVGNPISVVSAESGAKRIVCLPGYPYSLCGGKLRAGRGIYERIGVLYTHFIGRFSEYLPGCKTSVGFILRLNYQDEGNPRPKWQVGGQVCCR